MVEILLNATKLRADQNILGQLNADGKNCMIVALENGRRDVAEVLINDEEWRYSETGAVKLVLFLAIPS